MGLSTFGFVPSLQRVNWITCLLVLVVSTSLTSGWSDVALFVKQDEMRCVLAGNMSSKAFYWRHTSYNKSSGKNFFAIENYQARYAEDLALNEQKRLLKTSSNFLGKADLCTLNAQHHDTCKPPWDLRNWKVVSSNEVPLLPVVDRRWEDLPTIFTKGATNIESSINLTLSSSQAVNLGVSILAATDSFIYLCGGANQYNSPCYWIIINGWTDSYNGTRSAVRRCRKKDHPNGDDIKTDCRKEQVNHKGSIGSRNDWFHINVAWDMKTLTVMYRDGGGYKKLLSYTDDKPFKVTHAILQSNTYHPTLWKLHNYQMLSLSATTYTALVKTFTPKSDELCLSFFYRFRNPKCYFNTTILEDKKNTVNPQIYGAQETEANNAWKEASKQIFNVKSNTKLELSIRGYVDKADETSHQIVIDSVRECSNNGNMYRDYRELIVQRNDNVNVACQSLLDPNLSVKYQSPSVNASKEPAMRELLEQCRKLYNDTYCQNTLMCDAEGCYCDVGYTGDTCQQMSPTTPITSGPTRYTTRIRTLTKITTPRRSTNKRATAGTTQETTEAETTSGTIQETIEAETTLGTIQETTEAEMTSGTIQETTEAEILGTMQETTAPPASITTSIATTTATTKTKTTALVPTKTTPTKTKTKTTIIPTKTNPTKATPTKSTLTSPTLPPPTTAASSTNLPADEESTSDNVTQILIAVVVILLIIIAAGGGYFIHRSGRCNSVTGAATDVVQYDDVGLVELTNTSRPLTLPIPAQPSTVSGHAKVDSYIEASPRVDSYMEMTPQADDMNAIGHGETPVDNATYENIFPAYEQININTYEYIDMQQVAQLKSSKK